MEPRARAGKNVGKMNFAHNELAQLLYGDGDVKAPLPETVRVLDEIVTDFIQGVSFEATRAAHHAGRQKVKFEDFEFAMRRNPRYMGKIQEVFEKKKEIEAARKNFNIDDQLVRETNAEEKQAKQASAKEGGAKGGSAGEGGSKGGSAAGGAARGAKRPRPTEEELDEGDDDLDAEADIGTATKKRG
ncbi:transcription initiation factor IID, 18kD subunit-domain-containing protein [Lasiosphaeria miniovina]|uniref:Transcription initiation factor TFIID subunit 13 n=1 Tax=Lasiosphaeria miniovina TaxID=1954250 RepID=A0AA40A020_9PEZI|nr:transcription initiation factor IID, 18kD subunit-domain-containing protein [Lasiosphaeria miniovina]KAK0706725.1 transcription initiation factor IID, 18kD subunit-domain-containing protein [Lasiosphaeria miniovina]